ncbi:MAG: radical SAM protein [Vampirovibrio sp.]
MPHSFTLDPCVDMTLEHLEVLAGLPEAEQRHALGVDLSRYDFSPPSIEVIGSPINTRTLRSLVLPILKGMTKQSLGLVPNPVMLTHILTTRCNYSCGFCSFADSLNQKTDEMTLDEIELTYSSMGSSLNTIVYSGGETTLHPQIIEIIEAAYRSTPVKSVYIISNAWKPERLLEITHTLMQRCPDLHLTWSLSIEGFKTHNNRVRHTKNTNWDAWQNTIDTLYALKDARQTYGYTQLDVQLCSVCTPDNHSQMPLWYAFVRDILKPDKWNLNLMRRSVQMSQSALPDFVERRTAKYLQPFEETYIQVTNQVLQDAKSGHLRFTYHTGTPLEGAMKSAVDLISQRENRNTLFDAPKQFKCKAGTIGAYLSAVGEVGGCEEFVHNTNNPKSYGNVRDNQYNFLALWQGKQAKRFRQLTDCSTECVGCTLESQRNYPAILLSPKTLFHAYKLGVTLLEAQTPVETDSEVLLDALNS